MSDTLTTEDTEQILKDVIVPFVENKVGKATERPEIPMNDEQISQLFDEILELGLLNRDEQGGIGIWENTKHWTSNVLSIFSLVHLAKGNPAFAYLVHREALANNIIRQLGLPELLGKKVVANLQGHYGLARYSLARFLSKNTNKVDLGNLDQYYTFDEKAMIIHALDDWTHLLTPSFSKDEPCWYMYERKDLSVQKLGKAHGFDEINAYAIKTRHNATVVEDSKLDPDEFSRFFQMEQLGLLTCAIGSVENALKIADEYTKNRLQGGKVINQYPAVQMLISRAKSTLDLASSSLKGLVEISPHNISRVLSVRIELQPLLNKAANDCLQALGGMGYMRDAGVEKMVRDCNQLSLLGGSTPDLRLMLSGLDKDVLGESQDNPTDHIQGYTPPSSPYSPRTAFNSISKLTRWMAQYDPITLWEQDTKKLPRALRKLRRKSREFAEEYLNPIAMKIDQMPHTEKYELVPELKELLRIAGKKGLLTDLLPKPIGSSPINQTKYSMALKSSIKTEELARACGGLMLLLSAHHLGIGPIILSGDLGAITRFVLPAYRQNKKGKTHIFGFAITEPDAGSDVEESHGASVIKPGMVATKVKGGWKLNGRKVYISGGAIAKSVTIFAALEGEGMESWTCFLVTSDTPGYRVARSELKMGMRASDASELELVDVFVPDKNVIGGLRKGWALNRAVLNVSRVPVASMAVGLAQAAIDIVMEFASSYELNGQKLIHHQEVQLELSQMIAEISTLRTMVWESAKTWKPTQRIASINKFHATDIGRKIVVSAMQLLSNHGMLVENRLEKIFRDIRITQIFEGTNQINQLAVIEDTQEEFLSLMEKDYINHYGGITHE